MVGVGATHHQPLIQPNSEGPPPTFFHHCVDQPVQLLEFVWPLLGRFITPPYIRPSSIKEGQVGAVGVPRQSRLSLLSFSQVDDAAYEGMEGFSCAQNLFPTQGINL